MIDQWLHLHVYLCMYKHTWNVIESKMTKTSITIRVEDGLLQEIEAWRAKHKMPTTRTAVIEQGIQYFMMVNDQPDGTLELLEDMLSFYFMERSANFRDLADKTLRSVTGHLVFQAGVDPEEIVQIVRSASAAASNVLTP